MCVAWQRYVKVSEVLFESNLINVRPGTMKLNQESVVCSPNLKM